MKLAYLLMVLVVGIIARPEIAHAEGVNHCLRYNPQRGIENVCGFEIEAAWCEGRDCERNSVSQSTIRVGGVYPQRLHGSFSLAACKGANSIHQSSSNGGGVRVECE